VAGKTDDKCHNDEANQPGDKDQSARSRAQDDFTLPHLVRRVRPVVDVAFPTQSTHSLSSDSATRHARETFR